MLPPEGELLRFTTAGSVDDGKSTLIGRLLYDSKGVYEDQVASARKATRNASNNGHLDLSLLTDGLRAEREQGITIDVAYRYFATPRRKFIIADTPGHEQYTRNMATGASTANLAIILIDARLGVLPQSRRHAYISSLLGIPHLVVAINKMDLVDFRGEVFTAIRDEFSAFAQRLGVSDLVFIPISALDGDNVVTLSKRTPWYGGPTLLDHLETVPIVRDRNLADLRFPVQYVIRPNLDFRGFAGQLASGKLRPGDAVAVLPSGRVSRVKSIVTWEGEIAEACSPMSITVCLEDEIDVSRGDMLVPAPPGPGPHTSRSIEALVVWMNQKPLTPHRPYLLKHTTQTVRARVTALRYRVDINTLDHQPATELGLNEIGLLELEAHKPLFFDAYRANRSTGSFILIDSVTNETVAAGMITAAGNPHGSKGRVTPAELEAARGHSASVIVLPPGRLELAYALERLLFDHGWLVHVIEQPEHLRQAIRTACAAGMVAIVAASTAEDLDMAEAAAGTANVIRVSPEQADSAEPAREIQQRLVHREDLLTGGAGI